MSNRNIIVIGGSAGATAPLKSILANLPPDLPAAVLVVLHIAARGIGILSGVASSATKLPVRQELAREKAGAAPPVPAELKLEVEIAAGERIGSDSLLRIAEPASLTCPSCGGVLSMLKPSKPLRFRCQVGHAFTADVLAKEQ